MAFSPSALWGRLTDVVRAYRREAGITDDDIPDALNVTNVRDVGCMGCSGFLGATSVLMAIVAAFTGVYLLYAFSDRTREDPNPLTDPEALTEFGGDLRGQIEGLAGLRESDAPDQDTTESPTSTPPSLEGLEPPKEGTWSFTNDEGTLTCDGDPTPLAESPPTLASIEVVDNGRSLRVTSGSGEFADAILVLTDNTPGNVTYEGTIAPEDTIAGVFFEFELVFNSVAHALTTMGGSMPVGAQTCTFHRAGEATLLGG